MRKKIKKFFKKFNFKKKFKIKKKFNFRKSFNNYFKNSKFSMFEVILLLFVTLVFGVMIGFFADFSFHQKNEVPQQSLISEVYDSLLNNYYKEVDITSLDKAAISGIIEYLDDEYTMELFDEQYTELHEQINGYFCGIGVTVIFEEDKLVIVKVLEDSAAAKVGLQIDDVITKVDGINIDGENYIDLIKGQCNTELELTITREDNELTFNIIREAVALNNVSSQYFDVNDKYVGYIDVNVFSYETYKSFEEHLNRLEDKNIESLIIDLRNNPGGVVSSARKIMNLFFDKNTTLYSYESKNKKTIIKDATKEKRDYPIVILMNEETASSAEIFISCFKDNYKNIKLVGRNTYGKNTIQTNLTLTDDYGIKYTSSEWFTSKGNTVKDGGISPDVEIANGGINYYDDYQLQEAINLLK